MRVLAVIAALVLSLVTGGVVATGVAAPSSTLSLQEATPGPEGIGPEMVDVTHLGGTEENALDLFRTVVAPGAVVPSHEHLGANLMYVESGSITFTVDDGVMLASCAAGCLPGGTPDATGVETLQAGDQVELAAGDWVQQINTTHHGFRNDGDVDAVLLVASGTNNGAGACLGAC
jgi:quercetin dioxygenase-like cupin family protein